MRAILITIPHSKELQEEMYIADNCYLALAICEIKSTEEFSIDRIKYHANYTFTEQLL